MSHHPQRKEKNCLNCGITVIGKYCHNCGQENIEPKETFWQLTMHFFNDITHFDGKFFSTLKLLLFRPGFLPKEYMNGRRARYLNPVRMYIFTSFIFFLIFFSLFHISENQFDNALYNGKSIEQIREMDDGNFEAFTRSVNNGKPLTREGFRHYADSLKKDAGIHFTNRDYRSKAEYDSIQASAAKKDNWLKRKLIYKQIEIKNKYENQSGKLLTAIVNTIMHHFPQMLFISLPFVALFFKLLYARQKKFYYVSHTIFTVNFYIFVFIAMLLTLGISKVEEFSGWRWLNYVNVLISFIIFFYFYKAMRNFYEQGRLKTILKYFLFLFFFLFLLIFLLAFFLFVSIFQV